MDHLLNVIFLFSGELFQKARKDVQEGGYEFKKGFSRSSTGSSCSSEGKSPDGSKEEKQKLKRKNITSQERQKAIANIRALLQSTEDQIRIKQQRIQKLKTTNKFKKCDELSGEIRALLREKGQLESQLALLQRKEAQSRWYRKQSKKRSRLLHNTATFPKPNE